MTGYKHAARERQGRDGRWRIQRLKDEAALANELGFDATYMDEVPCVRRARASRSRARRSSTRASTSPRLAELVDGDGSHVFEHTASDEIDDAPLAVKAGGHTISCEYVVIATHTPLMGKTNIASATLLQTKLYLYTSYVVGGRVPTGIVPEALFWDTADPYHYLRVDRHRDYDYVIFGGEDHKTGQVEDTDRVLPAGSSSAASGCCRRSRSLTTGRAR